VNTLTVITSFNEKRREKQIKYERSMLKELTIQMLRKKVRHFFGTLSSGAGVILDQAIEEGCFDIAIEAYLLGSRFSRFGYYGETVDQVKERSIYELEQLSDALYDFIQFWVNIKSEQKMDERLMIKCEQFVNEWWLEGFNRGRMKYKLRLH
jgi:Protein of unknown function (DUF2521)